MALWRVIVTAKVFDQTCQNVLHFTTDVGFGTDPEDVKDNVLAQWVAEVRNIQNSLCIYQTIGVQQIDTPQPMQVYSIAGTVGALSGAMAPSFIAGVLSIRTAVPGRAGHGRVYVYGIHQDSISNGVFQSGAFAAFQTIAANLTTRFNASGTQPLELGVTSRSNPVTDFKSCTTIVAKQVFGVQRRRNIGVGG